MKNSLVKIFLSVAIVLLSFSTQAQQIKLSEVLTCFNAPEYPQCLFEMVENEGFERIDKEYYENCERIIYYYAKSGKPNLFINPMLCRKPYVSEWYPVKVKNELEFQFQKSSRVLFENISAQVRKQCKLLPAKNGMVSNSKGKATTKAYLHEATGTTIVIKNAAPVAYIYLLK
jgi:hypothetical protein